MKTWPSYLAGVATLFGCERDGVVCLFVRVFSLRDWITRQTDSRNKRWVSFRDLFRVSTTPRFPWVQTHRRTSVFTFLCLRCSTVSQDAPSHVCMSDEQRDALSSSVSTLTHLKRPHRICVCLYFTRIITDAGSLCLFPGFLTLGWQLYCCLLEISHTFLSELSSVGCLHRFCLTVWGFGSDFLHLKKRLNELCLFSAVWLSLLSKFQTIKGAITANNPSSPGITQECFSFERVLFASRPLGGLELQDIKGCH